MQEIQTGLKLTSLDHTVNSGFYSNVSCKKKKKKESCQFVSKAGVKDFWRAGSQLHMSAFHSDRALTQ